MAAWTLLGRALALLAAAAAPALIAGCTCPPPPDGPGAAGRARLVGWFDSPQRSTPLFAPAASLSALDAAGPGGTALPPLEAFAYRPAWPAAGATSLGEVTFYRERYYDRQGSWTGGRAHLHNYVHRSFEFYRTGALVR